MTVAITIRKNQTEEKTIEDLKAKILSSEEDNTVANILSSILHGEELPKGTLFTHSKAICYFCQDIGKITFFQEYLGEIPFDFENNLTNAEVHQFFNGEHKFARVELSIPKF